MNIQAQKQDSQDRLMLDTEENEETINDESKHFKTIEFEKVTSPNLLKPKNVGKFYKVIKKPKVKFIKDTTLSRFFITIYEII